CEPPLRFSECLQQCSSRIGKHQGTKGRDMASTTSCGVLLLNPQRELLLCHATGSAYWDIPKGLGEPGEAPRDTAVRETFEETCLRVEPERLLELGRFAYRPAKDLHLFATCLRLRRRRKGRATNCSTRMRR